MAKSGTCFGAKSVLDTQNGFTPYSPVVMTHNQDTATTGQKRWNTAYKLWKLKSSQPHLFTNVVKFNHDNRKLGPGVPYGGVPGNLPGFEPLRLPSGAESSGWFFNSERHIYLEKASDRCLWFDSAAGVYRDLHIGDDLSSELALSGVATTTSAAATPATSSTSSASSASRQGAGGAAASSSKTQLARHLVIMDLHKAAEIFKLDLNHLDRPAAMLAVYRPAADAIPPDVIARGLHEKLLRGLAAFRGPFTDEALQVVLIDAIAALASEQQSSSGIAGGVALITGGRLVVAVGHGAACMVTDSLPGDMRDVRVAAESRSTDGGIMTACLELDNRSAACVLLHTEGIQEEAARAAASHAAKGHMRAGAIALMHSGASGTSREARAAACARLLWTPDGADEPPGKRARTDKAGQQVRCRQILLRYVGCKQAAASSALAGRGRGSLAESQAHWQRKPVTRSVAEAEAQMLQVIEAIEAASDPQAAFTQQCRAVSECNSSLKGGDLAGDVGWLKMPEVKPREKISKEVAARMGLIRAALALEVGEVSDIVVGDDGVHLLKRSA